MAEAENNKKESFSFPQMEEEILSFWENNKIFEESVALRQAQGKRHFVFFEGPPTANGTPGVHHVEARAFKDIILRYKTMRGFYAPRRAGWDTHGLPVEVQVEKELGLKSKKDIEKYGVAAFNKKCKESVWKYKDLWEKMTSRMGFWIDMGDPYITYENYYIESLWAIIKEFAKKKYLYEDYKVIPWCVRCGTALSSHELAQGYEKIKENSVYVKFPMKGEKNTFFLAWTTTPWTLPGNAALAVNPEVSYLEVSSGEEKYILAEALAGVLGNYEIIKKIKGKDLVGMEYEPLYPADAPYKIVSADFVSTEEGTGIVHIAPAFGDEDFNVGKKYGLPVLLTIGEDGKMKTPGKEWDGMFFKDANKLITEDLKSRNLLFKEETHEHDYPFCWRCKTPLIYFARKTWWVGVNKVREELIANNEKINWYPDYLKHGRFGGWLKEKKDWAFSRERYWGTSLPVWKCEKCDEWEVIGGIDELKKRAGAASSKNKYTLVRHGEAEQNVKGILNGDISKNHFSLTDEGRKQVEKLSKNLKKVDLIFTSPFLRAKETAEILARNLKVSQENIKIDPRLAEISFGALEGTTPEDYFKFYKNYQEKFEKAPEGGENLPDVKRRMGEAFLEIDSRYKGKNILVISHEYPLWMLWAAIEGKTNRESIAEKEKRGSEFITTAGHEILEAPEIPRNDDFTLDLHKPYIDEIKFDCSCGGVMKRVPEVVDVWFDSGSMPFAQSHWPFNKKIDFPADYIVEAIDQTRGWFYNLLAVATLLGKENPYKNVISVGHLLDAKGKKMSKSLGNIVEPIPLIQKYGADAVRWYFFTINQPWDSKLFSENDVKDSSRRFFMILWNTLQFLKMYGGAGEVKKLNPNLVINKWVLSRLNQLTNLVTEKIDSYDIVTAARDIENFVIEDLSRWYIRRIRDVMKDDSEAKDETSAVLKYVLLEVSKILAPFAPFISEKIYQELGGGKKSVHLEDWIEGDRKTDTDLLSGMSLVRSFASTALMKRAEEKIKVRQPLQRFSVKHDGEEPKYWDQLKEILKDEINVREVVFERGGGQDNPSFELDTNITPELKEEGMLRDLIREIQSARKTAGLTPKDKVDLTISAESEMTKVAEKYKEVIQKETNSQNIKISEGAELKISFEK